MNMFDQNIGAQHLFAWAILCQVVKLSIESLKENDTKDI